MGLILLLFFFLFFILLLPFLIFLWKHRTLPPGPVPLPLFGNLLSIARAPPGYAPFQAWSARYGPIFTVWFGADAHIVVTDHSLMKATTGDAFSGRHYSMKLYNAVGATRGLHGIIRTEGAKWLELRRFAMRAMRSLDMEAKILKHTDSVLSKVRTRVSAGAPAICLEPLLDQMNGSTIGELVFGINFEGERETELHELKRRMHMVQIVQGSTRGQLLDSMPWLRHVPPFRGTFRQLDAAMARLYAFFDAHIDARMEGQKEKVDDILSMFLEEMENNRHRQDSYYTMDSLRGLCFDLFVAGQETSSNTLNFLFLYLLLDQRSQRRVHAELDGLYAEIGTDRMIGMADRPRLPFLCAVINETQRLCNLLPVNLSHRTLQPVQLGPYSLSKGTPVLQQISSVMLDEQVFPEPDLFRPERFLDADGLLRKCEQLVPFGVGKRQCAGEPLARMELFLFAANFLAHFHILPVNPLKAPSTKKLTMLTVMPEPYECIVVDKRTKAKRKEEFQKT